MRLIFSLFLLLSLAACQAKNNYNVKSYDIQGAYFGAEAGQIVLLSNAAGSVQAEQVLKANGSYSFNLTEDEVAKGPFFLIYTYGNKPTPNPKPPYIKTPLELKRNLFLPAILVFPLELNLKAKSANELSFNWTKTAFSQGNQAKFNLFTSFGEGFIFKKERNIKTKSFAFNDTEGSIDLSKHTLKNEGQLSEKLKKVCKTEWYLELPYHYPEGIDIVYASAPVSVDFCKASDE